MKDLQGIVGDEDTGEGREKSGELRVETVEILLQVEVRSGDARPLIPSSLCVIAPSVFIQCVRVNKYLRSISGCFFIQVVATAKLGMCKMQELSPLIC